MAPILSIATAALMLAGATQAHFNLLFPPPVGTFDEDTEGTGPCGGVSPDFSKSPITNFSVDGQSISTLSGHPQVTYIYRITTDKTAAGNWTEIYPIIQQTSIGSLCIPKVTVPESYVGQEAVLGVAANGPDGILFQCAAVKFIAGTNSTLASGCANASSVTTAFVADPLLTALVGSTTTNTTSSPSGTGSAPAATTSAAGAAVATFGSMESVMGLLFATGMMALGAVLI